MAMTTSTRWVLRIAGFLAVVVLADWISIALGLKYWMPGINDRSLNIYAYQRAGMTPDVLLVGTSRLLRGLDPLTLDTQLTAGLGRTTTTYSVAQRGASCFTNSIVLSDVIASNGIPRIVILEVSPGSLNAEHGNLAKAYRYYCSLPELIRSVPRMKQGAQWNGAAHGVFRGFANLALYGRHTLVPRQEHRWLLDRLAMGRGRTPDSPDQPVRRLSELDDTTRRERYYRMRTNLRFRYLQRYQIGGPPETGLRSICRVAAEHGFQLVVLNPPVTPEYRRLARPKRVWEEYNRFMSEFSGLDHVHLHDLDAGQLALSHDDFVDFNHLNADGARKLSVYVAEEILAPLLRSSP
jgi:hypothetical protein